MEFTELLRESKWKIITAISNGHKSPTSIAKATGMSLPHITQNVAVLEAAGIIKKRKETRKELGKPKNILSINKEEYFFATISKDKKTCLKKSFVLNEFHKQMARIMNNSKEEDHFFLMKLLLKDEITDKIQVVALIDSNDKEIHLLLITEYLDFVREKFSNVIIKNIFDDKEKKIVCWSHSVKELDEGLAKNEKYFHDLMKKPISLIDKINYFK